MPIDLYDRTGEPVFWLDDDNNVHVTGSGHILGWLWGKHLITYVGEQIAVYENGWLRDLDGHGMAFAEDAVGGPSKPEHRPLKRRKSMGTPPERPQRGDIAKVPDLTTTWSIVPNADFLRCVLDGAEPQPAGQAIRRWTSRRDRLTQKAKSAAATDGGAEPQGDQTVSNSTTPVPAGAGTLDSLNSAIASYRSALDSGDAQSLALARIDLGAAAERYAVTDGRPLSS